jgi:anti-sigma regulatory factor (Ser/Thr protein kinase)
MEERILSMEFKVLFTNVDIARAALQGVAAIFFGKDTESASDITMAVNEAMNNAVEHTDSKSIKIEVFWCEKELKVLVISGGKRFDPVAASAGLNEEDMLERGEGGYGLYLIKELVDSFEYEYRDGCNFWKLAKQIRHL